MSPCTKESENPQASTPGRDAIGKQDAKDRQLAVFLEI